MGSIDDTKQDIDVAGSTTNNVNTHVTDTTPTEPGAGTAGAGATGAKAQAFHPLESDPSITVLSFKVPPAPVITLDEPTLAVQQKEAYFHICLDTSGSMAGSGMQCAKEAMKELFLHLVTNCKVPAERISVYLYSMTCSVRQMGRADDLQWMNSIQAGGGNVVFYSFALEEKSCWHNKKRKTKEWEKGMRDKKERRF